MEQQFSLFVDSKLDSPKNLYLGRVMGELGPTASTSTPLPSTALSGDKLSPFVPPQRLV